MSDHPKVYIAGMGMITSIGGSAETTAAAVRARRKGMRTSSLINKKYLAMTMATVPEAAMPDIKLSSNDAIGKQTRYRRMLRLGAAALTDAMQVTPGPAPIPLFLAGPENLHPYLSPMDGSFIRHLVTASEAKIDLANSRLICTGRAGGVATIELAFRYMEQTKQPFAMVGGVDSYIDLDFLGALERDDRVSAINNMDGFVPGEGAGFLLLASEHALPSLRIRPFGAVSYPGLAKEPGHRYSTEPYRGDGLVEAFRRAIENGSGQPIQTIYSSLNGEHFGAKEFGVATIRNGNTLDQNARHEHPADGFGDIGAAFAPILIGLAALDLQKGWRQGPALVYCSSDGEHRGACCVEKIVQGGTEKQLSQTKIVSL